MHLSIKDNNHPIWCKHTAQQHMCDRIAEKYNPFVLSAVQV